MKNADCIRIVNYGLLEVERHTNSGNIEEETIVIDANDNGTESTEPKTQNSNEESDTVPVQKPVFEFLNCKEVYYEGGGIGDDENKVGICSTHANATIEYAPEHHSRENEKTSFRTAISVTCCEKVEIKNAAFSGLEYAILLMTPNNDGYDLCNGDVTIRNIKVTDTAQPIFVADTHNVTIENATMTSRESMGSGDHFIYCSRYVDNVYIKDCTLNYSDENFGCAINLCNSEEDADVLKNSVKFCRIDNVEVDKMYRQFVSAKADTRIICNNCKVTTRDNIDVTGDKNYIPVFFVSQRASIDIINCTVDTKNDKYMLASLCDNVHVNINHGKFTGLKALGSLSKDSGNEGDFINLNISFAEIQTEKFNLYIEGDTTVSFNATFDYCNLFTSHSYFFQSKVEKCKIACYNCKFTYIPSNTLEKPPIKIMLAYFAVTIKENEEDKTVVKQLLDNIKIINCIGNQIAGVNHANYLGEATVYGNFFTYTYKDEDIDRDVTVTASDYVPDTSITLNMLSPELQAAITPLLTTS